jgi:two-component system CheB/CheR fusion protein
VKLKKRSILPLGDGEINFPVIGIGGSAGSFKALDQFFSNTPRDIGMAFIVILHLDPTKKGMLPEILQRTAKMKVIEAADGELIKKNTVYIIPPAKDLSIINGRLLLLEPTKPRGLRMPIDFFLQSLALDQRERAAAVILSGMGTDGELGLKMIKESLGLGIVQDPHSSEFNSMPQAAISSGFTDYILLPEDMPEKLINYFYHPAVGNGHDSEVVDSKFQNALLKIFMLLRTQTGHDFSMYKRSTINRRIDRRIAVHQLSGISEYVNYLRENAHEIDVLFKELLIGVTKFFRDPEAFEALIKPLTALLKSKKNQDTVRVWIAGCSTGEEAYSIAILLLECMEKLKVSNPYRVQVFATDLDAAAIEKARTGIYYDNLSGDVSVKRLERYFIKQNNHYIIKKEVRELVIFAQHNIIKDSPFTKLDLLCCRNLLIYLNAELQKKLMPLFHYSLNKDGILFLGNSETIGTFSDLYNPVSSRFRIFSKKDAISFTKMDYPFAIARHDIPGPNTGNIKAAKAGKSNLPLIFQNILLERFTPPSVIINERGDVLYVNGNINPFSEIRTGEPEMNIHKIAKNNIRFELSNLISKSISSKSTHVRDGLNLVINEQEHSVKLTCLYLREPSPLEGLIMMIFEDQGIKKQLKISKSKGPKNKEHNLVFELEKELSQTRLQLESTIQQMEASYEELKSANEELQSTNEELQSTNEESITSKEEMQSLNEELMTLNMQYQSKSEELTHISNDLNNLMDSMEIATVFLNNDLLIKRFTPKAAELLKLISSDVGRPLLDLSSAFVYKNLEKELKEVIRNLSSKELPVTSPDGKFYSLRVTPYRTSSNYIEGIVLAFIDVTGLKELENKLNDALAYSEGVVDSIKDSLVVIDNQYKIVSANQSFRKMFKLSGYYINGTGLFKLPGWQIPELKKGLDAVNKQNVQKELKITHKFSGSGLKHFTVSINGIRLKDKNRKLMLLIMRSENGREK